MKTGILVDYEWCSGCHSCEMACTVELSHAEYPEGHAGVKVMQEGPYKIADKTWTFINVPIFTDLCDYCVERLPVNGDTRPSCIKHCQARCLTYGSLDELVQKLADKPKQYLWVANDVDDGRAGGFNFSTSSAVEKAGANPFVPPASRWAIRR